MRMTNPIEPDIDEPCNPGEHYPNNYFEPPSRFVEPGNENRLSSVLTDSFGHNRDNPVGLLVEAVRVSILGDRERGNALADLAVTGRRMYERFKADPPTDEKVYNAAMATTANPALSDAVQNVLDRAYQVVWMMAGFGDRAELGWIATSGELDTPRRPVNVPSAPFPQHDLVVNVRPTRLAAGRTVTTRMIITSGNNDTPSEVPGGTGTGGTVVPDPTLPPEPVGGIQDDPAVQDEHISAFPLRYWRVGVRRRRMPPEPVLSAPSLSGTTPRGLILFIHGHSSRLEECLSLVEPLSAEGFSMIAMDLPNCGYGSMFDHTEIADDTFTDTTENFPLLEFVEQFVIDFVLTLQERLDLPLSSMITGVIGGSLGGNLGLRLEKREIPSLLFLTNIVSWSPASTWDSLNDLSHETGPNNVRARMREVETPGHRRGFFYSTFEEDHQFFQVRPQGEYWYRDGWPCKAPAIRGARASLQEVYNVFFRRWHWRLVLEQLLFSHQPSDRREQIRARTLLAAGSMDNYTWSNIYDATKLLSVRLPSTPGQRLLMQTTGHSIHSERPRFLSREISRFLPPVRPGRQVAERFSAWQSLGGNITSRPAVGMNEDGRLEVFARFEDSRLYHTWQAEANGSWGTYWDPFYNGLGDNVDFGRSIAVASNEDGRLQVFATVPSQRRVGHTWQNQPNSEWSNWDFGVDGLIGGAADGVCAIDRSGEDEILVNNPARLLLAAALRHNGKIHVRGHGKLIWWPNGSDLGQDGLILTGVPAIATNQDGRLEIFARGSDGNAYHIWENSSDNWVTSWSPLASGSITSDISVAITIDGRLQAFARAGDGSLLTSWQVEPNGGWHDWENLGGTLAPGAAPAVALNGWGQLQVFVRWQDGSIRHRRQKPEDSWTWENWQNIGGNAIHDPVVHANMNGQLVVFQVNADRSLQVSTQTALLYIPLPTIPLPFEPELINPDPL